MNANDIKLIAIKFFFLTINIIAKRKSIIAKSIYFYSECYTYQNKYITQKLKFSLLDVRNRSKGKSKLGAHIKGTSWRYFTFIATSNFGLFRQINQSFIISNRLYHLNSTNKIKFLLPTPYQCMLHALKICWRACLSNLKVYL